MRTALEDLLALARGSFRVPIALLTLPDGAPPLIAGRAADAESLAACGLLRAVSRSGGRLTIPDARDDARLRVDPVVAGPLRLRFYAGRTVPTHDGPAILSLFGRRPRRLSRADEARLDHLASLAARLLRDQAEARAMARALDAEVARADDHVQRLADHRRLFDQACAVAKIGIWQCDLATETLSWTDAVYDLFELPRGGAVTRAEILRLYTPESLRAMETARARAIRERSSFTLDAEIVTARGNRRWMRLTGNVECEGDRPSRIFGMKQDITAERTLWERTRFLAETDVLTGLANRGLFQARLAALDAPRPDSRIGALLLIDLDGFKPVNDTYGHAAGDVCLREVADRLRMVCREADLVARIGGDEFAVLLGPSTDPAAGERVAMRIVGTLRAPITLGDHAVRLGASVGIAVPDGCGGPDLFVRADLALYAAKAAGKNTFRAFTPDMRSKGDRRAAAAAAVTAALSEERVAVLFRPRLGLADRGLVGIEAVPRVQGPPGEEIGDPFAAAASEPAAMMRIGTWTIDQALRHAAAFAAAGLSCARLAIPVSGLQLRGPGFGEDFLARVIRHGLDPRAVEIAVAESVFAEGEPGQARAALQRLRQAGLRVIFDAPGSVAAVLGRLRNDPVDAVKIDRVLTQRFLASPLDRAILDAVLRFCAGLAIDVVADGVETEAQREGLLAVGCTIGQGPLLGEPWPAAQAASWLPPADMAQQVA
ncbi:putative bifunctional diguanylate cyclase/phosphodiesterase [Methylobacterium sp. ID0610]|uniref:putative bifunctional diguanylate cyclase/phosphodiesterase n=1 Tax=Methylobacterium carpenticola TaxID=3344827 RepID=UPI0036B08926